jgi:cytosine/adenosine deaminase-related metal-dependent hydrolase
MSNIVPTPGCPTPTSFPPVSSTPTRTWNIAGCRENWTTTASSSPGFGAKENRATGVGWIIEHSDRIGAREAMETACLEGTLLQEVITFFEHADPSEKLKTIREKAILQNAHLTPHAPYTVDAATLKSLGSPISIHFAETPNETQWVRDGTGPMAEAWASVGYQIEPGHRSIVAYLDSLGLVKPGNQFVHACAVDDEDLDLLAQNGVHIAHCPRSNDRLGCPIAPIRQMLERGIPVGIGLDSPASSGPIDMFAEMRMALHLSRYSGNPITAEQIWQMATRPTFGAQPKGWFKLHVPGATQTEDLLETGAPARVEWV